MIKILDFYSDTCPPCRLMKPVIEKAAKEFDVEMVNIKDNPSLFTSYSVDRVPTLVFLKNGEEAYRKEGTMSLDDIRKTVEEFNK